MNKFFFKIIKINLISLGLGTLCLIPEGQAQERTQKREHLRSPQEGCPHMSQEMRDRRHKLRQVSGEVLEMKSLDIKGTEQKNVVLLLKTNKGNGRLVVDLGPVEDLKKLELSKGSRVAVEGEVGRLGDRTLLIAHQVKVADQVVSIDRKAQTEQAKKEGHKDLEDKVQEKIEELKSQESPEVEGSEVEGQHEGQSVGPKS